MSRLAFPAPTFPAPARLPSLAFVLVWSTGFIVGKAIVPLADTSLFLLARFAVAGLMFVAWTLAAGAAWPPLREAPRHLLAGALMQGVYLCAGYGAVAQGLPPAIMALLGALQPLLTALLAIPLLKELPSRRTWQGLALGALGVALVVVPAMQAGVQPVSPWIVLLGVLAIVSITMGTLLQKSAIAACDLRASSAWQNLGAMLVAGVMVAVMVATECAGGPHTDWQLAATLAAALAESLGMPADQHVFPLMAVDAYLRANLSEPLRVAEVAGHFGWSVRRFQTLFAEAFGDTPHRYQTRLRLDRAVQLLSQTALPLAEIALASGYPDQTTFTRSFTRRFGQPPGAWRAAALHDRRR